MNMILRKGREGDRKAVLSLYEDASAFLKKLGIPQWQDGYPGEESFLEDLRSGTLWVWEGEGGKILGTASLCSGVEPTYLSIDGRWLTEGDYATIHRSTLSRGYRGRGLGKRIFSDLEELARSKNIPSLRVDTHEKNERMNRLIQRSGYTLCGVVTMADGSPRLAYEKILED